MNMIRSIVPTVLALALGFSAGLAPAAELPLGLVEAVDSTGEVVIRFDASVRLVQGQVLTVYGSGRIEKHPLTGDVLIDERKAVAKVQVLALPDGKARCRILWKGVPAIEAGMDAVPLPGDVAPNGPPVSGSVAPITAQAQTAVAIKVPFSDPDGDPLMVQWSLSGALGASGRLDATTTSNGDNVLFAPGIPGSLTVKATVTDPIGQSSSVEVQVTVAGAADIQKRTLAPFARWGAEQEPALGRVRRGEDGSFIGIGDDGSNLFRLAPGWLTAQPLTCTSPDNAWKKPVTAISRARELFVLDASRSTVMVYEGRDSMAFKRKLGAFSRPTDLAIAADGTVYVADQSAGGIQVLELSGQFRCRLGTIEGTDAFTGLSHLALTADGTLHALDAQARKIHRFDRNHRRLDTWTVLGDPTVLPIDLAIHSRGVAVLLSNGQIQFYGPKGTSAGGDVLKGAQEAGFTEDIGKPASITADPSGDLFVCHAATGAVARYVGGTRLHGIRGPGLMAATRWAADGLGRLVALDTEAGWISIYDPEGWMVARGGGTKKRGGVLEEPTQIAVAQDGSAIYVIDLGRYAVVRFNANNLKETPLTFGAKGASNGQFQDPVSICVDGGGRFYVLDADQGRVQVFDAKGTYQFALGSKGSGANQLDTPQLVAATVPGDAVFVYDDDSYLIKKFTLDHQAGTGSHAGNGGGKGDAPGQVRKPLAMACDRSGLIYVLDGSREDLQTLDFRGNGAVGISTVKAAQIGVRRVAACAVAPDGQIMLAANGQITGLR